MAYSLDGLYQVGPNGAGPRLWMYSTTDAQATVRASGYFDDASDLLAVRDIIFVIDTNTPTTYICNVLSNASGVVDISDGLQVPETDTD